MAKQVLILFFSLVVGLALGDIDFGTCTSNDCLIPTLEVNDCNEDQLTGFIISPGFPGATPGTQQNYRTSISSCPKSLITLTFTNEAFSVGPSRNSFTIGNGIDIGSNVGKLLTSSGGGNDLPDQQETFLYTSTTNGIWIEANLPDGRAFFKIQYDIVRLDETENTYNESSGVITSLNYGTSDYPVTASEEFSKIDVSEGFGEYVDLLLTVNDLDIKGYNGDFLKIGQGLDKSVYLNSALLSWRGNKGIQFLVDGPRAHLLFKVFNPLSGNTETPKGFSVSYEVIEKNLTTPSPPTTPQPSSPTPLPLNPDILQTELVYKNYESDQARSQLAEVLQKYAESSGMLQDGGEITPELSEDVIEIVTLANCYHGWNLDATACGQVQVIVDAFYQKGEDDVTYAFPNDKVKEAVRSYGYIHDIVLPEDLVDFYWVIGGVAFGVIILVGIGLILCWREKIRREYSKESKYQELRNNHLANSANIVIEFKSPKHALGIDNLNFVYDEEDHRSRGSVIEYDPERGSRIYSRSNSAKDKTYVSPSTPLRKEAELERTAVLNVSPITSNFQWQAVSDNSANMSSIMPPLAAAPKRGILKSASSGGPTVRDLPTTFSVMAEDVDDVLYDTNSLKALPSHRRNFQSSSSSETPSSTQSSRKNSISTDQQISSHVVYGITLNDISDDENETNL